MVPKLPAILTDLDPLGYVCNYYKHRLYNDRDLDQSYFCRAVTGDCGHRQDFKVLFIKCLYYIVVQLNYN